MYNKRSSWESGIYKFKQCFLEKELGPQQKAC